ncbi:MAG: hypothetical protein NT047_00670 [Deltaproteobacteria bacterium]|nr:hypothetical protein [Deltaproteobacteria bacterium]
MKFVCYCCHETLKISYIESPIKADFISCSMIQHKGIFYSVIACLKCGTVHQVEGNIVGHFLQSFNYKPMKVTHVLTPYALGIYVMSVLDSDNTGLTAREIALNTNLIPEKILDLLFERKLLGKAFSCP